MWRKMGRKKGRKKGSDGSASIQARKNGCVDLASGMASFHCIREARALLCGDEEGVYELLSWRWRSSVAAANPLPERLQTLPRTNRLSLTNIY